MNYLDYVEWLKGRGVILTGEIPVPGQGSQSVKDAGVDVNPPDGQGKQATVNFLDYVGYLKNGSADDGSVPIKAPHETSKSVKNASEQIPGVTTKQIRNRLELLLLPSELLKAVDNGTLTKSAARVLVRFRKLGDVDQMHEQMMEYGEKKTTRGDSPNGQILPQSKKPKPSRNTSRSLFSRMR